MNSDDQGEEVGYGKPPKAHQFKPGKSGNPKGRPRRAETMPEIVAKVRDEMVPITIDGKRKKVPLMEAALRQTIANCFKSGNPRHLEKMLDLLEKHGVPHAQVLKEDQERHVEEFNRRMFEYLDRMHPDQSPDGNGS